MVILEDYAISSFFNLEWLEFIHTQIGKGRVLVEGKDVALLGYGSMVQNCLKAHTLLAKLGIEVTVADARFCKPLDIKLLRQLCKHHSFLITVEEGSIGGFGSHVAQFIALDGLLDGRIKVLVQAAWEGYTCFIVLRIFGIMISYLISMYNSLKDIKLTRHKFLSYTFLKFLVGRCILCFHEL